MAMEPVFRSGAFLQQCWSVHPLCVSVRRITGENQLALACTSCRFAHYVTIASVAFGASGPEAAAASTESPPVSDAHACLASCLDTHPGALSLREMDVFKDLTILRCAECRRHYAVAAAGFETHQK